MADPAPRIYPPSRLATAIVWLLDRMPERVRVQVLGSYWSPADLAEVRREADDLAEFFREGSDG